MKKMEIKTSIRQVSECFIKPDKIVEESTKPYYLGPNELIAMSLCHLQIGLMYNKLPSKEQGGIEKFLEKLKQSLSTTLASFYPLAGQFVTEVDEATHTSFMYVDNNKGKGAKFIHACLDDVSVDDIVSPTFVPSIVQSLFAVGRIPTNYDAHDEPILVIQVTQLLDGIFLGVSVNHAIVDGTTYWHFLSSWSEIFQSNGTISRQPIYECWLPEGSGPITKFPYTHPDEFIRRYEVDVVDNNTLKELIVHFSSESLQKLKAKANADFGPIGKISSVQALSALLMRVLARSHHLTPDKTSVCVLMGNARSRFNPPLPEECFGNFALPVIKPIRVEELKENSLGHVASLINKGVADQLNDERVRNEPSKWMKSPMFLKVEKANSNNLFIGGVPRADLSKVEFGLGEVVALRSGSNKYDGRVFLRPGMKEKGSINAEVSLPKNTMVEFQRDEELMTFLTA